MNWHAIKGSPVAWTMNIVGWLLIVSAGGWDLIYHLAPFVGVRWSPAIDQLGEFGHSVIFFGMFIVVLGLVVKRAS